LRSPGLKDTASARRCVPAIRDGAWASLAPQTQVQIIGTVIVDFRRQARDAFGPSMRQKIDVADLYADALAAMPDTIGGQPSLQVPTECPVTLDDLLDDDP
jgi:hypothetical protein